MRRRDGGIPRSSGIGARGRPTSGRDSPCRTQDDGWRQPRIPRQGSLDQGDLARPARMDPTATQCPRAHFAAKFSGELALFVATVSVAASARQVLHLARRADVARLANSWFFHWLSALVACIRMKVIRCRGGYMFLSLPTRRRFLRDQACGLGSIALNWLLAEESHGQSTGLPGLPHHRPTANRVL